MIKNTLKTYIQNSQIIFLFIILYALLSISALIKIPSTTPSIDFFILIISQLIQILIYSIFLTLFISASYLAIKNKFSFKKTLKYSKFVFGNFIFLILLVLLGISIFYLANSSQTILLSIFGDSTPVAQALISYFGFLILSIFLLFTFMFYTLENQSTIKSLKNSIIFGYKNYLKILIIPLAYLIFSFLISYLPNLIQQAIYYLVIYPLLTILLVTLFDKYKNV